MGFKAREFPCAAVLRNSGEPCLLQEPRGDMPGEDKRGRG
jgi:hypothetical protein